MLDPNKPLASADEAAQVSLAPTPSRPPKTAPPTLPKDWRNPGWDPINRSKHGKSKGATVKHGVDETKKHTCLCGKEFTGKREKSAKGNLNRHILEQNNPGQYTCPWCDHRTSRKNNLEEHKKTVHRNLVFGSSGEESPLESSVNPMENALD